MIPPLDAWALTRLTADQPVHDELQALSEPFRGWAKHLASLPLERRAAALEAFLSPRDDRDDLIAILSDVDPLGPSPAHEPGGDEEAADGWGPIRLGALPPAAPFPVDVFPESVRRLISEGAAAIGCPPDFLAVPVLALAGGVIGRSVSLLLKDNYFASATIFAACVGPPSDGKTPALKATAGAVRQIDAVLESQYAQAREQWEEDNRPATGGKKS